MVAQHSVRAITGVDIGDPGGPIPIATSPDPSTDREYAIGPSCTDTADGRIATPAVRLRDFLVASRYDPNPLPLASICGDDYMSALGRIADSVRYQLVPTCVYRCAADADTSTDELDPDCELRAVAPSEPTPIAVPMCVFTEGDWEEPSEDVNECWVPVTGDDIDEGCRGFGLNLELRFIRRPGHRRIPGANYEIACTWSAAEDQPCPG